VPELDQWLAPRSGKKVPARKPGGGKLKVLGDAPGSYVLVRAGTMNAEPKRAN
jgi:polyhydroxyalkanoate synthase